MGGGPEPPGPAAGAGGRAGRPAPGARSTFPSCPPARCPTRCGGCSLTPAGRRCRPGWREQGTIDHLREFVVHRAAYQLQEADPHSFAIPRLATGISKTALLELQLDEYGGHEPTEAHAALFATTMGPSGWSRGRTSARLPAATLMTNTFLNRLGRSRRLVGACLGHLAVFEMTSVEPMARYAAAVRRLVPGQAGTDAARFYDVHVAADAHHARLAIERLVERVRGRPPRRGHGGALRGGGADGTSKVRSPRTCSRAGRPG